MSSKYEMPKSVKKRDGHVVKFNRDKIETSIGRSMHHAGEYNEDMASHLADEVAASLRGETISSTMIRESITRMLTEHGLAKTAKYYNKSFMTFKGLKIKRVVKRDGSTEAFDPYKIFTSMHKAFIHSKTKDGTVCERITKEVVGLLNKKYGSKPIPVEQIKDHIEYVLIKRKLGKVAKYYIMDRFM